MRRSRAVTAAALLAFALLAVGCSTLRLAYDQGPTLVYWWLDRYVDFAPDQSPRVRTALAQWFARHRRDHLAEDVALLDQAALEIRKDLSPAQACSWWGRYEKKRDLYLGQLAPALAEIAPMLSPSQWQHIQAHFDQTNDDWRDDNLDSEPHKRERSAVERVVDRAESLYGRLDREQREFVAERMRRSAWEPQRWFDERLVDQRDTLQALRDLAKPGHAPTAQLETARAMLVRVVQPSSEAMRQYRARLLEDQCAFAAELHNRSHPAQRQKASDKLSGWAQDLRVFLPATALSANPAPAVP